MSELAGLPRPGDVVAGKYRIERALGAGGMGAVYAATQTVTGKAVALKCLQPRLADDPDAIRRFVREARAAARIRHPNVVDIYGVEEQEGRAFLVFELLEGETLRDLIRRGPLPVAACLGLLIPAMRGVAAAHGRGVVHRDVKPDNVFVTRDPDDPARPIPKVLDFGISKVAADSPLFEGTLTATGAALGTPHYMSLEQLQGVDVDARADVYAFGVVLYECLTGRRPFESDLFAAIVVKAATETPPHPSALRPEIPSALGDLVLRAMARARDDRPASLQALIEQLGPFATEPAATNPRARVEGSPAFVTAAAEPTQTSAPHVQPPDTTPARRPRLALGLSVLTVTVAAAATAAFLLAGPPASAPAADAAAAAPPPAATTPPAEPHASPIAPGADSPPSDTTTSPPARAPTTGPRRAASGWVYLGDDAGGAWRTRYFDGWSTGLPAAGTTIVARGRSFVREAMPDPIGALATIRSTIGPEQPLRVLEISRWQGSGYVWARVESAR